MILLVNAGKSSPLGKKLIICVRIGRKQFDILSMVTVNM